MKKLNRETTRLPANKPIRVLQFGGGNFLRAFVDWMIDELNKATDFNAGVVVVKPTQKGDYLALKTQDGLFHVLTNGIRNDELVDESRLIQCVQQVIHPYNEWDEYLKSAECPTLRFIVSNTTESGIHFNKLDQFSDCPPIEFPAKLTRWLFHRWQYFRGIPEKGCVHLPCELIENNGLALKICILKYSDEWGLDDGFKKWIHNDNYFCNTLVDRIVPGFPKNNIEIIYKDLGFEDALVVKAEPYYIWVIEAARIIQSELPFKQVNLNVVFTDNLTSYRDLKVRILNGAHIIMALKGHLKGFKTVRETIEDEAFNEFLKETLNNEILPTLDFPKAEKVAYLNDVLDRFKNPFIDHQLLSILLNASTKFKTRLLPSLIAYIDKTGKIPKNIVATFAVLIYVYRGESGLQKKILKDDETTLLFFKTVWEHWYINKNTSQLVVTVLENSNIWGENLNLIDGLAKALEFAITNNLNDKNL